MAKSVSESCIIATSSSRSRTNWTVRSSPVCLFRRSFLDALPTLPRFVYLFLMAVSPFVVESGPSYTART